MARADHDGLAGLLVEHLGAGHATAGPQQFDHAGARRQMSAVSGGGASDRRDHPCIVLGAVVELHRADRAS